MGQTSDTANATVDAKAVPGVVENNVSPVQSDKGENKGTPATEEKSETPVVNGDATTKEDKKDDSSPAKKEPTTTDKSEQPTFFAKLKKHMSFKNINIMKKKKAPKETVSGKKRTRNYS